MKVQLSNNLYWLYQWDTGQKVLAPDGISVIHFRVDDANALPVEVVDGWAEIPAECLQSGEDLAYYAYDTDHTMDAARVEVKRRPRPADYAYSPAATRTWEQLDARIKELTSGMSPTVTTSDVDDGTKVVITDVVGDHEFFVKNGSPATAAQVSDAVTTWLTAHPDATTTVQDGAVTWNKLANEVKEDNASFTDVVTTFDYSYSGGLGWYFGGSGGMYSAAIDISTGATLHVESTLQPIGGYCYDLGGEKVGHKRDDCADTTWMLASSKKIDGAYRMDLSLTELRKSGVTSIVVAFAKKYQNVDFDASTVSIRIINYEPLPRLERAGITSKMDKIIDVNYFANSGYSGAARDRYGANKNWYKGTTADGFIDLRKRKTLYIKGALSNAVYEFSVGFGCFDENREFLYLTTDTESEVVITKVFSATLNSVVMPSGEIGRSGAVYKVEFPDSVKYATYVPGINISSGSAETEAALFVASWDPVYDLLQTYDDYLERVTDEFRCAVSKIADHQDTADPTGVFIGDSLTNWGGGDANSDGFLKIVHDKTRMAVTNLGMAGATWQGANDQYSAVGRVDAIVANKVRYDLYCFIMGTNGGSATDTGESSSDKTTMPGAIRYCMETLKKYDPTARLLVCLPPQRSEGNDNQAQVNDVIKSIVEKYSVRTLDLYHHSGIVPNDVVLNSNYLSDGLHLGANGITALGNTLAAEIKYLLCL